MIRLELLDREHGRFYGRRCDGFEKSVGHGLLDHHSADIETVHAASVDEVFAGAVITRRRVAAAIVNMQTAATVPAGGEALQQCRSLSHRAPSLMRLGPGVGVEPCLVGLKGGPIDEARMMILGEHGPLIHGQMPNAFSDSAVFIHVAFVLGLAVGVSASIHRIGENLMECMVGRSDPADRTRHAGGHRLQRER